MKFRLLGILLIAWLGQGCSNNGNPSSPDNNEVVIRIQDDQSQTPISYMVSVAGEKAVCGIQDTASANIKCSDQGVILANAPDSSLRIIIKARGSKTLDTSLDFRNQSIPITLIRLPAFIQDTDQATGLNSSDGYATFQQMAYKFTSELGPSYLLKFIITDLDSDPKVHLVNTQKYRLHYEFAQKVLGDTRSVDEFEMAVYFSKARTSVAGTLAFYPSLDSSIALTFFSTDMISSSLVLRAHRLLEERLQFLSIGGIHNRLYYLPSGSEAEIKIASQNEELLFQDILRRNYAQLFGQVKLQILNTGTAYGKLRRLSLAQLDTAILSFRDIVLLDRLPAILPLVGGTITAEAQTPLSHVNLAAKARNTPNIAFPGEDFPDSLLALVDSMVQFTVTANGYTLVKASLEDARKYWESQSGDTLRPVYDLNATGLPDFSELGFTSSSQVGVKAANLAELHSLLEDNTNEGFAVPFYHYDQFLSYATVSDSLCGLAEKDCLEEARAQGICAKALQICQEGTDVEKLGAYISRAINNSEFQSDSRIREAVLDGIQYLFRHIDLDTTFAQALNNKAKTMFGDQKIRLRSSTNAEDLANFNGAGLYESVSASTRSGDLPADEIRKVWASVWSYRAFEERSWWNIDHLSVKMGVAVHLAYSDEVVNGVVLSQNIADYSAFGIYANMQLGETSITNPSDTSKPEIVSIIPSASGTVQRVNLQYSSYSPGVPLLTEAEARDLYQKVKRIQEHFAVLYKQSPNSLILDIEFKLVNPDRKLIIKQVRPYIS